MQPPENQPKILPSTAEPDQSNLYESVELDQRNLYKNGVYKNDQINLYKKDDINLYKRDQLSLYKMDQRNLYKSVPVLESLQQNIKSPRYSQEYCEFNNRESELIYSQKNNYRERPGGRFEEENYEHYEMSRYKLYQIPAESTFGSDSGYSQHTSSSAENSVISENKVLGKRKDNKNLHRSIEYMVY